MSKEALLVPKASLKKEQFQVQRLGTFSSLNWSLMLGQFDQQRITPSYLNILNHAFIQGNSIQG